MIRVYFGHHKCASQYIKAIFLQTTALLGMIPSRVDNFSAELPLDYHLREPYCGLLHEHRASLASKPLAALCLTNGDNEAVSLLERRGEYRGFHVIRDPRDVLVSAYFSHRYSHPIHSDDGWMAKFRHQLNAVPDIETGLLLEMDFNEVHFGQMATWDYTNPWVYETRYETLTADPQREFERIFTFLGISILPLGLPTLVALVANRLRRRVTGSPMSLRMALPRLLLWHILARNSFERQAQGRHPGQEDVHHHYRKGISGDWHTYFSPRLTSAFKERFGEMLVRLGYERSTNW